MVEIFIGTKKVGLEGKTQAQLEHLLQLARDQYELYLNASRNYPPGKGAEYRERLDKYIQLIKAELLKHESL